MSDKMPEIDPEKEKQDILKAYRKLLRAAKRYEAKGDLKLVRKAFDVALDAHKDMRRKSGEPYIYHPIAVAEIVTTEIGLGAKSIVCALLHDTVEDTDLTVEDMRRMFGDKVAQIIDGLTKLSGVLDIQEDKSLQAENFRKMLLTMSSDIRVILIKLADRLHNMRTLGSMRRDKQLKIASETMYLYAPLAHRLGLYSIKTELEDLSFKYIEPELYEEITSKLKESQAKRTRFINKFSLPIINSLNEAGVDYEIKGRTKSVYSIARKMKAQGVPFEEVYDIFAIRLIINSKMEDEKSDCWKVYSLVTDHYVPNPGRFRDWVSKPKSNGYESLHTTVMSESGKWVEVQIRTKRMDDIAEKGLAAHWKYKETQKGAAAPQQSPESGFDDWLAKIRELLENPDPSAIDFIDDFKLSLFAEEIFVFTPTGEVRTLPANATSLDFAFDIHTEVGMRCIGAKVNGKLFPLSHQLKSGDQVEVLTSNKQKPKEDWLTFVITTKAKSKIKHVLKAEKREIAAEGKEILERKMKQWKVPMTHELIDRMHRHFKLQASQDLFIKIAKKTIDLKDIKEFVEGTKNAAKWYNVLRKRLGRSNENGSSSSSSKPEPKEKSDTIVIGDASQKVDYIMAKCCKPIPGDDVFGFVTIGEGIKIHRTNCPNAIHIRSNYAYRIVPATWAAKEDHTAFVTGILITGIDDVGLVNAITTIISTDLNVNMKSIAFESNDGVFEGHIKVMVEGIKHLNNLIEKLKKVKGIRKIVREDELED